MLEAQSATAVATLTGLFTGWLGVTDDLSTYRPSIQLALEATVSNGTVRKDGIDDTDAIVRATREGERETAFLKRFLGEDVEELREELLARINAVLRRSSNGSGEDIIEAEGLVLDTASQRVTVGHQTVQLGPTEYRLLSFFMTHAERVYSRTQLLDRVWGGNVYVEERTVDVHIRRLRKALEAFNYDRFIQTVRGSGYRFSTRAE